MVTRARAPFLETVGGLLLMSMHPHVPPPARGARRVPGRGRKRLIVPVMTLTVGSLAAVASLDLFAFRVLVAFLSYISNDTDEETAAAVREVFATSFVVVLPAVALTVLLALISLRFGRDGRILAIVALIMMALGVVFLLPDAQVLWTVPCYGDARFCD